MTQKIIPKKGKRKMINKVFGGNVGNKDYGTPSWIDPEDCYVDVFNRDLDKSFVKKIAKKFDPLQFGRPIVSLRKNKLGTYSVIDGQHRIEAHKQIYGEQSFPCVVREHMTFRDEAVAYMEYNKTRKNLHSIDIFRGDVHAGSEDAVQINNILNKYKIIYGTHPKNNELTCIGTLRIWFAREPKIVDDTLRILSNAWSDKKNAYTIYTCSALVYLLKICRNDAKYLREDRLIEKMKKHDPLEIKNSLDSIKDSNFSRISWIKDSNPFGAQIYLNWYNYNRNKKNHLSLNIFGYEETNDSKNKT